MKIVDNMPNKLTGELEKGEIIKGNNSGHYYMIVISGGVMKALNLEKLNVLTLGGMDYERTGIKRENITITFE